jgi:hypothetical protein
MRVAADNTAPCVSRRTRFLKRRLAERGQLHPLDDDHLLQCGDRYVGPDGIIEEVGGRGGRAPR